jgi:hypothetical protein
VRRRRPGRLLLLPLLLLAGCGDTPVADVLRDAMAAPAAPVTTQAPIGGPVLRVTGPRRPLLFTLAQESGRRRLWQAEGGGAALATEGARIISTAGFGQMLVASRFDGPDPLLDPHALEGSPATARRIVDLQAADRDPGSMRFGLVLQCRLAAQPDGAWLVVQEDCAGGGLGFTSRFWVEPATGAIRRSEQWVGDDLPLLTVEAAEG